MSRHYRRDIEEPVSGLEASMLSLADAARPGSDGLRVTDSWQKQRFMEVVASNLDDGLSLARWLTGSKDDADDVTQEAAIRAFKAIGSFHGTSGRAWFLAIVRNTAFSWVKRNRPALIVAVDDEAQAEWPDPAPDPEAAAISKADQDMVRRAIDALPLAYREVIVLREIEQLSYQDIATVTELPVGTVMSRLSRARGRLMALLAEGGPSVDNVRALRRGGEGTA